MHEQILGLGIDNEVAKKELDVLLQAINKVSSDNIWTCYEDRNESLCIDEVERTFTYELYRQWKDLLVDNGSSLTINAEISKIVKDTFRNVVNTEENANEGHKYPDFVLHKGQGNTEEDGQILLCEVKRKKTANYDIVHDFEKFLTFMQRSSFSYPYAYSVFIQVGVTWEECKNKIREVFSKNANIKNSFSQQEDHCLVHRKSFAERTLCISYKPSLNNEGKPTIDTLYNILNTNL